jgi:hypothetical protein
MQFGGLCVLPASDAAADLPLFKGKCGAIRAKMDKVRPSAGGRSLKNSPIFPANLPRFDSEERPSRRGEFQPVGQGATEWGKMPRENV